MRELTIADTSIRTDDAGRYCLNDLHRASGGESRHQPANWLRLQSTQDLADELARGEIPQNCGIQSRQGLGTFVAKELVYAYAMWISPAFHLKVIRAYDSMASAPQVQQFAIPQSLPEALRLAADLADQKARAEAALAVAAPKAEALDLISAGDEALTMTQAAKVLGVKRETLTNWMHANGWVYRQNGSWVAYDQHIKAGRLQFKEARYTDEKTGQECLRPYCHILPKGMTRLALEFGGKQAA